MQKTAARADGAMPNYRVNQKALKHARELIDAGKVDAGKVDVDTEWSDAAPSADDGNAEIERHGWDVYAARHLALDQDANDETKGRYRFPFGDFSKVNRAALIHGKQRAAQNDHAEIEQAFDELLRRVDGDD